MKQKKRINITKGRDNRKTKEITESIEIMEIENTQQMDKKKNITMNYE